MSPAIMQTVLMIVVFGGMMFFFQRSQKKQQKKREETLNQMQPGSKVVTIGGLHGVIFEVNDVKKTVTIDCEGVYLEFERAAIRTVEANTKQPADETKNDATAE